MSSANNGESPQVLVVGAGPVGLTAAHELARHGVRVRLVDAAQGPATTSRALATHARTLETYDQMGLADEILPRGRRVEHFTLHQNGRRLIRFDTDYSKLPTRFPFTLMIDQCIAEEVLRTAAAQRGVSVEWGVRLLDFTQDDSEVRARLQHPDGRVETVTTPWLVGTDGGHSTVRKHLGLVLSGESSETWLIADAQVECDLPTDSIHWLRTPRGTVMMVPFPETGKWRLLDTAETDRSDDQAFIAGRFAEKIAAGTGRGAAVADPSWISVFTIQQRMLQQMRVGRVFVAGDAAHVHSPASGQGLNTGIQDAFNLSWKLAAVLAGEADGTLLDSYTAERVPVGAELLRSTRMATVLIQLRSRAMASLLRVLFTVVRSLPPVKGRIQRKIMGGMSALGLSYADIPPARGVDPGPAGPGARAAQVTADRAAHPAWAGLLAELRSPGWTLVSEPDPVIREDLGMAPDGWLLIRPDGYVAATSVSHPGADGAERAARELGVEPRVTV